MPMIDVYAPADLFPAGTDGRLGEELTMAVLRAEGVANPGPFHLNNTAAFIHRMDPHAVHTAATDSARTVRVQVITPPAALTREGQKQLSKEVPATVARISGDPTQASRTWMILTEAAEGGWGLSGTAYVRQEDNQHRLSHTVTQLGPLACLLRRVVAFGFHSVTQLELEAVSGDDIQSSCSVLHRA